MTRSRKQEHNVDGAHEREVEGADRALRQGHLEAAFTHLERPDVPALRIAVRHPFIHWRMLASGPRRGDLREGVGQAPRIEASILFSRPCVPRGKSGRTRVSALEPTSVPHNLWHLVH